MATLPQILARCRTVGDCLIWTGATSREGYGRIRHDGRIQPTHRVVYTLAVGPIPDGLTIDHVSDRGCTSRLCMNVAHLEPVTLAVNGARGRRDQLAARDSQARCVNGHPRDDQNLGLLASGRIYCRECNRIRNREAYAMRT